MRELNLIVLDNSEELGKKVNEHLMDIRSENKDFRIPIEMSRFSNGEGKVKIKDSIRDNDVFILSDVGNYDVTYKIHNREHYMSPDEHYQDIKRVIAASSGHAERVSLVTPLLYESRQHKRKGRESLDCAIALQEVEHLGIKNLITFDAHDPSIVNAVPRLSFSNYYPTGQIIQSMYKNNGSELDDLLVIAPDFGAMERARFYSEILGCDVGCFYKRRDLSRVVNGKNPIVDHLYLGRDVTNKDIIIVDDMISSGSSVLDVTEKLKGMGAKNIFICTTFALFTEGIEKFDEYYKKGFFNALYSTNVSYVPEEIKNKKWYNDVDCSRVIAQIIDYVNRGESLEPLQHNKDEVYREIEMVRRRKR